MLNYISNLLLYELVPLTIKNTSFKSLERALNVTNRNFAHYRDVGPKRLDK